MMHDLRSILRTALLAAALMFAASQSPAQEIFLAAHHSGHHGAGNPSDGSTAQRVGPSYLYPYATLTPGP